MFTPEELLGYVGVAAVLVAVPGPNTALIVAQSLAGGRRAGLATVVGIELGTLVHIAAAALGLSAMVASSALAFEVVKLTGAGVLILLGVRELLGGGAAHGGPSVKPAERLGAGQALVRAFVGNVLNPKVAVFFLAFLPQWVDPTRGSVLVQTVLLGGILVAIGVTCGSVLAFAAIEAATRLVRRAGFWRWQRRLTGGVLIALGVGMLRLKAQ